MAQNKKDKFAEKEKLIMCPYCLHTFTVNEEDEYIICANANCQRVFPKEHLKGDGFDHSLDESWDRVLKSGNKSGVNYLDAQGEKHDDSQSKKFKKKLDKYRTILALKEERVKLIYVPPTSLNQGEGTSIQWYEKEQCWILRYEDIGNEFDLIHELGHLYLYKETDCRYFAESATQAVDKVIFNYNNSVVDSFVNYKLSCFDEIYPVFINYVEKVLNSGKRGIKPDTPDLLSHYINFYCDLNYSLKQSYQERKKKLIHITLANIKKIILEKKEYRLSTKQFESIDNKLKEFDNIKSTKGKFTIISFIAQLLKLIPLWNESKVNKQVSKMYDIKKRSS